MNCSYVREYLLALLYGDLDATTTSAVRSHLASCHACLRELAGLEQVRGALDSIPAPSVQVDLPRLFEQAAARQARQARHWRRATVAVCGVAAALLVVVLLGLEVRVEAHQLVVRWGHAQAEENAPQPRPVERILVPQDSAALGALEDRVQVLDELLHAVITDISDRDKRQQQRLASLQEYLEQVRMQNGRRLSETERNVAVMRTALFAQPRKGEKP
jgi:anti-sigma factor RsiW